MSKIPIKVDSLDMAFGGKAMEILPKYSEIPQEFKTGSSPWSQWQSKWFYDGLKNYPVPKEGIDLDLAMQNLKCCQASWEPKHEHKVAGVAYLASQWFSSPNGAPVKAKS